MVRKTGRIFFSATLFCLVYVFFAQADVHQQRQSFLQAEKALEQGRMDKFHDLSATLTDYPLYPYLIHAYLVKNISLDREKEILDFIEQYSCTPLSGQLRSKWLDYLADNRHWSRLVRDYQTSGRERTQCAYGNALHQTGRHNLAWDQAERLWLHGRSRAKECDPLFDAWRKAGRLTTDLVWERIALAMAEGQLNLAAYLQRYLPEEEKSWLELWLETARNPSVIMDKEWSRMDHPVLDRILVYAMGRLIRDDTVKAADKWDMLSTRHGWSRGDFPGVEQEIALYLALRRHEQALQRMKDMPEKIRTSTLREWHVRTALYHMDWEEVARAWNNLTEDQKSSPRWQYWQARALEELGKDSQAADIYRGLLGRQNYFSLLAADRLQQPYTFRNDPLTAAPENILKLYREPGIQRALELFYLERFLDARREWARAMQGKKTSDLATAAVLAHDLGWTDRAIQAAASAGEFQDLVLRFPLSYVENIQQQARDKNLDPAWILAVARQESMFMPDANSPAGALGIMQIMPATGRIIASRLGESIGSPGILLNPETSIRYGTFYLHMRLEELQQNPVLATAAYNAGAGRIRSWLPENCSLPADIWVEIMPYRETRDYVERVFAYTAIYHVRMGQVPPRLTQRMPVVLPRDHYPAYLADSEDTS